ncbi:MAG: DUF721 domain-containing protein [Candidatus Paceibacterota bacterium]
MSFSPLKKLIKKRLEKRDLQQGVIESKVAEKTKEVLKEQFSNFADQVKVLDVKDGRLILKADNSSVAQEIQLHQEQIIEELNKKIDKADIKKITFKSN